MDVVFKLEFFSKGLNPCISGALSIQIISKLLVVGSQICTGYVRPAGFFQRARPLSKPPFVAYWSAPKTLCARLCKLVHAQTRDLIQCRIKGPTHMWSEIARI